MKDEIPEVAFHHKGHNLGFEIQPLEDLLARAARLSPRIDSPHRVQFHNLLHITHGSGIHQIDFVHYPFKPGDLLFIARGQVHRFEVNPQVRGHLLLFTKTFLETNLIHSEVVSLYRLYNTHLHSPVITPGVMQAKSLNHLFAQLTEEYRAQEQFGKEEILRLLLKVLLLKAERAQRMAGQRQKSATQLAHFSQFKDFLAKELTGARSVRHFASRLRMTAKHLNAICKNISGLTAKQYIDEAMVLEIKRQLATSETSIQELSYNLGFDEPTNFIKFFKKHSGQTPAQFRKSHIR